MMKFIKSLFMAVLLFSICGFTFAHGKGDIEEIDVDNVNSWKETFDLEGKTQKKAVKYNIMITATDLGGNEMKYKFYTNPENWNSILNLQLLSGTTNESKNDEDLASWVESQNIDLASQIIPKDVSLDFDDFEVFLSKRKELLINTIKSIIRA